MSGLRARVLIARGADALVLQYPLGASAHRPAYVHKEHGMAASGSIALDGAEEEVFADGVGGIDWTITFALRETRWRWVSLGATNATVSVDGGAPRRARVGVNLSNLVYDVTRGGHVVASSENGLWLDGELLELPLLAVVHVPDDAALGQWRVAGADGKGVAVDLVFRPHGLREDHTGHRAIGMVSDFVQPFGAFHGHVEAVARDGRKVKVSLDWAYGVMENHHAIW
jgi:hypothetical protein